MNYDNFITAENIRKVLKLHFDMSEKELFEWDNPNVKRARFAFLFDVFTNHEFPRDPNETVKSMIFINGNPQTILVRDDKLKPDFESINGMEELMDTMKEYAQERDKLVEMAMDRIKRDEQKEKRKNSLKKTRKYQNKELGIEGEMEL